MKAHLPILPVLALAAGLFILPESRAAQNVYLELTIDGTVVLGESHVTTLDRADKIECFSLAHDFYTPRVGGQASMGPVVITKRIDKSSPLLAKALSQNQSIEAVFRFYRHNTETSQTEHFYSLSLEQARLVSFRTINPDTLDTATANRPSMEEVSFSGGRVTWENVLSGTAHQHDNTVQARPAQP